jgi:hypothetical protein
VPSEVVAVKDVLPASVDTERFVLGSIPLDAEAFGDALASLSADDFSIEKHRRIFCRMSDLHVRGKTIDRVTIANELLNRNELESCDGLSYLLSLDDGLPRLPNIDSYLRILQEKASLRRIVYGCQHLANRAKSGDASAEIAAAAHELFSGVVARGQKLSRVIDLPSMRACGAAKIDYIRKPELPSGAVVALTGDSGSGQSTLVTAWARDVIVPVLFLDRENPVSVIIDRLDRLGFVDCPRLRFWGGWLPEEAPLPDSSTVVEWVKLCMPRPLVVVDSLVAFHGGDENDAAACRGFMHRCRRLADLGATVVIIHHDGKSETAKDFRGSSDFKAAIDLGFHVSNFSSDSRLDKVVLRPFKQRIQVGAELAYEYAHGQFVRSDTAGLNQTVGERLMELLRLNPGVTARKFEELASKRNLGRNRARTFLNDGLLSKSIRPETGARGGRRYFAMVEDDAE